MSNLKDSFYSRLDRLYRLLKDHQGIELNAFYQKGRRVVEETVRWGMVQYTFKMVDDGQARTKDVHVCGKFIKRVLYTTDYTPEKEGMP